MSTKKNPPKAAETSANLSEAAQAKIAAMRTRTQELLAEIGRLEMRKAAILVEIKTVDNEAGAILAVEAKRLGIPEGQNWRVDASGRVTF